jgi:hypothetical protein
VADTRARNLNLACWIGVAAFDLFLVIRLFQLINRYSVNLIYWDNFNYYFLLAGTWNCWQRFAVQLGPHRQGFGMLISSVIAPLSHWNMRAEAFCIGCLLCLAAGLCIYLKHRMFGQIIWLDFVVIPALFLSPIQWEVWTNTVNSSHGVLPVLFVVLLCLACTIECRPVKTAAMLIINFLAVFTGFGFFLGVIIPIVFATTRNWIGLGLSLTSLALFFVGYHFDPANPTFRIIPSSPMIQVDSLALGLSHAAGLTSAPMALVTGFCLLLALIVAPATQYGRLIKGEPVGIIVVSCATFTLLFMLAASWGRESLGPSCLMPSRYFPLFVPGFVALYFAINSMSPRPLKISLTIIAVGIALLISARTSATDRDGMDSLLAKKQKWLAVYESTDDLDDADRAAGRPIYPAPRPANLQAKIEYLRDNRLSWFYDEPLNPSSPSTPPMLPPSRSSPE